MIKSHFLGWIVIFSVLLLFLLVGRFNLRWQTLEQGGSDLALLLTFHFPAPTILREAREHSEIDWSLALSKAMYQALHRKYTEGFKETPFNEMGFIGQVLPVPDTGAGFVENDRISRPGGGNQGTAYREIITQKNKKTK